MPVDVFSVITGGAIRSITLALAAAAGLWLFRVRSPAARHAAWTVALLGMLLQLLLEAAGPTIPLRLIPAPPPSVRMEARLAIPEAPAYTAPAGARMAGRRQHTPWREVLAGLYLSISLLFFGRMLVGYWGLLRILRSAAPAGLGPRVFESPSLAVPGSAGCFRPKILLPAGWRDWEAPKLRAVLAHERAHIRRHDWLIRVLAQANVCVFWFHPLSWWMERHLSVLAEEACDDVVLEEIEDRDQYAAFLVDMARAAAAFGRVPHRGVVCMARESNVVRRVNRILDCGFRVSRPFGHLAWAMLLTASLPVIYLSAAVQLVPDGEHALMFELPPAPPPAAAPALQPGPVTGRVAQAGPSRGGRPAAPAPSQPNALPISLCILIDNSGSMRDRRAYVLTAALGLTKAARRGDEVCIMDFNDETSNDLPAGEDFTTDRQEMEQALLTHIDSRGGTVLRDAVRVAMNHLLEKAHNARRVLVVITDGDDTSSTGTAEPLLQQVRNAGVPIYPIGLLREQDPGRAVENSRTLTALAAASGGRSYFPSKLAEVERVTEAVAQDVRTR